MIKISLQHKKTITLLILFLMFGLLSACGADDNDHFCARYSYLYTELEGDPNLPSYGEMKTQLLSELSQPDKDHDQAKFMLFVLEDFHSEIKTPGKDAKEFCMKIKRWESYR
jgi:hypothetical protein